MASLPRTLYGRLRSVRRSARWGGREGGRDEGKVGREGREGELPI